MAYLTYPTFWRYPAVVLSVCTLGIKPLAVVVHLPKLTDFSAKLYQYKNRTDAFFNFKVLLLLWIGRGKMFPSAMISSVVIMGKVNAEGFLSSGPVDLLKGKPFLAKLVLVCKLLPVLALTFLSSTFTSLATSPGSTPRWSPPSPSACC